MERFMEFTFVAAQRLPKVGPAHQAARLHGHSFRLRVTVAADPDPALGWIMDPAEMRAAVNAVLGEIDHRYLNELPGLENPSTENLCRTLAERLAGRLPGRVNVELWENQTVGCVTPNLATDAFNGAQP